MDTRKINLYDIDEQMRTILENADIDDETGEFTCDTDALAALEIMEDAKMEALALYIQELEATADAVKPEADRLYAKMKTFKKKAEGYSKYLEAYFNKYCERRGIKKFQSKLVSLSYRKSSPLETIDEAIAMESAKSIDAVKVETTFDKEAIKRYIKNVKPLAGFAIVERQKFSIK